MTKFIDFSSITQKPAAVWLHLLWLGFCELLAVTITKDQPLASGTVTVANDGLTIFAPREDGRHRAI